MEGRAMEGAQRRTQGPTALALTLLAIGIVGGVYLVLWASRRGLAPDAAISPYHVPAYSSLAVLLVWVVVAASRAVRLGSGRSHAWPLDDPPLLIGLLAIVAYIVLDVAWREVAPIGPGIEGAIAPTRLLLAGGLALVAGAPLRMVGRDQPETGIARIPAMLSAGLVAAGLGFALLPVHPAFSDWMERPEGGREDDSEIWLMDADGGRQTRLLQAGDGIELSLPAWSPDGRRLAGTGWDVSDPDGAVAYLWTAEADGSGLRRITNRPGWQWIPAWSPAGDSIAYTVSPIGPTASRPLSAGGPEPGRRPEVAQATSAGDDIWLVRPDGSGAHALIAGPGDDFAAAWSSDGRRLAFVSGRDGNAEIYIADADGMNQRRVTTDPGHDWAPGWSPDGRQLVFTSDRGGSDDIWVVNVDGTGLRQLTDHAGSDAVPAWSPRGDRIAFVSDRSGDVDVWTMASDGRDLQNLTRSPSSNDGQWSVAWSPDGRLLAYASAGLPPALNLPLLHEDLAVAGTILTALLVAGVATLAGGLGFGTLTALFGIDVGFAALAADTWPLAVVALGVGLLFDLVLRRSRPAGTPVLAALAGIGLAAVPVLAFAASGSLYWTPTLTMGVLILVGAAGWVIGTLAGSGARTPIAAGVPIDRE
jgi:TolB protein